MSPTMLRSLVILLSLALMLSIAANLFLGFYARQFYYTIGQNQLDPLGVYRYSTEPALSAKEPEVRRVVFFGDSRAEAWPAPAGLERYQFINRGIGGQTTEQVLGRFDAHVRPLQPDVLVIQAGVNDLQNVALFPDRREWIVQRCKQNLRELANASAATGATVILTTIFPNGPISWDRWLFWNDDVDAGIVDVNAYIASLASGRVLVFDTAPILQDERGYLRSEYRQDFLHLNEAGYAALNVELARLLNQIEHPQ